MSDSKKKITAKKTSPKKEAPKKAAPKKESPKPKSEKEIKFADDIKAMPEKQWGLSPKDLKD